MTLVGSNNNSHKYHALSSQYALFSILIGACVLAAAISVLGVCVWMPRLQSLSGVEYLWPTLLNATAGKAVAIWLLVACFNILSVIQCSTTLNRMKVEMMLIEYGLLPTETSVKE